MSMSLVREKTLLGGNDSGHPSGHSYSTDVDLTAQVIYMSTKLRIEMERAFGRKGNLGESMESLKRLHICLSIESVDILKPDYAASVVVILQVSLATKYSLFDM